MVEIVDGLHLNPELKDLHGLSNNEMEERAKLFKVRYSEDLRDSKGVIRLCRFRGNRIDMSFEGGKLVRTSNSGPVGSANTSSVIEASSDGLEDSVKGPSCDTFEVTPLATNKKDMARGLPADRK